MNSSGSLSGSINHVDDPRVSGEEFTLDTAKFAEIISKADSLANTLADLKNSLDGMKNNLMFSWSGKGRNTFEKKYRLLSQQFGDMKEDLRDIANDLRAVEESYIQADTELSKKISGVSNRY